MTSEPARSSLHECQLQEIIAVLVELVARHVAPDAADWARAQVSAVRDGGGDRVLAKAIGLASRKVGKGDLSPTASERARLAALRPGFDLTGWSVDQLLRAALITASWQGDDRAFAQGIERFVATAELNELIALYRGFPLYPAAAAIEPRGREATRSAMRPLFEAMAHRNPYPREVFSEDAWNQMVVKAVFIGATLWPIDGLDARANADLAHERWAAGRAVTPEIWRCVAPFADDTARLALRAVADTGTEAERRALGLALALGQGTRDIAPDLVSRAAAQGETWPSLIG